MFLRDDSPRAAVLEAEIRELEGRRTRFRRKAAIGAITDDALEEIEAEIAAEVSKREREAGGLRGARVPALAAAIGSGDVRDRKSTRLNSSHANISYAVFCLKKKKKTN